MGQERGKAGESPGSALRLGSMAQPQNPSGQETLPGPHLGCPHGYYCPWAQPKPQVRAAQ